MNRNRAKKYLRQRGVEQQRVEMPQGGIELHNLLADFEQYCLRRLRHSIDEEAKHQLRKEGYELRKALKKRDKSILIDEIEIKQGKDGEVRYVLTQEQFDRL